MELIEIIVVILTFIFFIIYFAIKQIEYKYTLSWEMGLKKIESIYLPNYSGTASLLKDKDNTYYIRINYYHSSLPPLNNNLDVLIKELNIKLSKKQLLIKKLIPSHDLKSFWSDMDHIFYYKVNL